MFLEWWMIGTFVLLLAAAMYDSYRSGSKDGVTLGAEMTLLILEKQNIIRVLEGGEIQGIPPEEKNENNL